MTKEEALEIIKANCSCSDSKLREACAMFIPELRESEDERIIKKLQEYVKNRNWSLNGPTQDEVLAWLEKQKEKLDYLSVNRVKVRPDGGTERHTIGYLEYQKERGPLTKDEEYTLNRIIEYLEDNDCPSEWKNLLVDIHNLPYQKGDQEDNGAIDVSANFETAEREKSEFVGGHFIQCNCNLDNGLKRGEHYWLEYIGDDMYVGRSDNILNQEFHIRPRQLFTLFTQQLEETEEMHSVFKPGDKIRFIGHGHNFYTVKSVTENYYICNEGKCKLDRSYTDHNFELVNENEQKPESHNPYDMSIPEAQEYIAKRGFDYAWNDGDVFVDERFLTQTVGNVLRWGDDHPEVKKP